ncbi:MAG TPA: DNA-deoxyinosine glycosylase [Planctomycetota bacterium]|nr:DNA-deoxyinosine glycosylase [Planctomycetota bacterium]
MATKVGFPAIASRQARVLILGSMPGVRSLAAGQYYAHPHNAFWHILGALCGFTPGAPYRERTRQLRAHGIALWDVLQSCERPGSLDSSIVRTSMRTNDFATFLARHRRIGLVLCNGSTAFSLFTTRVRPELRPPWNGLHCIRMPSTSPANAGLRVPQKLAAWRAVLAPVLADIAARER